MKTSALTLFLALSCSIGLAQSKEIDSLKHELSMARHDTTRVWLMTGLADSYRFINQDSALFYAEKAVHLAHQIKFTWGEIWALSINGAVLHNLGNLPKALELEFKALKIAEDSQIKLYKGGPIIFIGRIYTTLNDLPKALYYGRLENEIYKPTNIEDSKFYAKQNLAQIFEQMNQLDSALYYLQEADKKKAYVREDRNGSYITYGNVNFKLGNYPLALSYYKKNLLLSIENKNHQNASRTLIQIARLFQKQDQADSSIFYAKKGLAEAQLVSHKEMIFENSMLLSELYEPKDTKEAFRYYKLATITKDSLFGAGNIQAMQAMIAEDEARRKEVEAEKIAYQNKLKQYGLLTGLVIMFLIGFIIYRNNRQKQKANIVLQEQKEKVETTLSQLKSTQAQLIQKEKLASLGELTAGIAHEIQNPLNFVNNFSELSVDLAQEINEEIQKPTLDKDYIQELMGDLSQNQEKINHHGKRAASIVRGMLEHSRSSSGEPTLTDLNILCDEYLRLSYQGMRAKNGDGSTVRFNADYELIPDPNLPKIKVVPGDIGRVLLNIINNAFQARSPQRALRVVVSTEHTAHEVVIRVQDNGTGISDAVKAKIFQPFFTTKPTGEGTGLGLSLAYDIVTKGHGGTLECESVEGVAHESVGTTFVVKLPI